MEKRSPLAIGGEITPPPAEVSQQEPIAEQIESAFNRDEVWQAAKADVNFLAALILPEVFTYDFPPVMLAVWQLLTQKVVLHRDFSKLAIGLPRGHAKSTLMKIFIVFCILFTTKKFILIVGATATLAENILADVADMLDEPNIKAVFGDWRLGMEKDTANVKKFGFLGRPIILAALGAGSALRGLNLKNARPDIILMDDMQTKEDADSDIQSQKLSSWMVGTLMKAKNPTGCLYIFVGNMYATKGSLLRRLKHNPQWVSFISGAILADGTALWPELHPLPQLLEEFENDIAMGHPEVFLSEVQNDENVSINLNFDTSKLPDYPYTEDASPQGKFIVIDPSAGKSTSDDLVINYAEVIDGKPVAKKIIAGKLDPGQTIREALKIALETGCTLIAVESGAYQSTLLYWFQTVTQQLGITGIHFRELHSRGVPKNTRISNMLKQLLTGDILLHPDCRNQAVYEATQWNPLRKNNTDNILDTLAYYYQVMELYQWEMTCITSTDYIDFGSVGVPDDNCCF